MQSLKKWKVIKTGFPKKLRQVDCINRKQKSIHKIGCRFKSFKKSAWNSSCALPI